MLEFIINYIADVFTFPIIFNKNHYILIIECIIFSLCLTYCITNFEIFKDDNIIESVILLLKLKNNIINDNIYKVYLKFATLGLYYGLYFPFLKKTFLFYIFILIAFYLKNYFINF
jgi:hypothetical protein